MDFLLHTVMQVFAQSAEKAVDRSLGSFRPVRDALDRRFVPIAHVEDFAMFLVQLGYAGEESLFPLFPSLLTDRGFRFFAEKFQHLVAERFGAVAFRSSAIGEDLIEENFPRPGREVGSQLEVLKLPPHHDFAVLENILGVLRARDESGHVDAELSLMLAEESEEGFGALVL